MSGWIARGYVWISEWQKILEGRDCNLQSRREREACTDHPGLETVKPASATWNRAVGSATTGWGLEHHGKEMMGIHGGRTVRSKTPKSFLVMVKGPERRRSDQFNGHELGQSLGDSEHRPTLKQIMLFCQKICQPIYESFLPTVLWIQWNSFLLNKTILFGDK